MSRNSSTAALTPSRFRWMLRFSLRSFFILLTTACLAGGWFLNRVQRQRAAVQALEQQQAYVSYDVYFVPADQLEGIEEFNRKWNCNPGPVPKGRALAEESLRGKLCRHLGQDFVATIKVVSFDETIQSPDLRPLDNLPQVEKVLLDRCHDLSQLQHVGSLHNLRWLELHERALTEIGFLSQATQLRKLNLQLTLVHDLSPLVGLHELEDVNVSCTPVSDLSPLAGLSRLKTLGLYDTKATDLTPLHQLTGLKSLTLAEGQYSEEALRALQAALPGCKMRFEEFIDWRELDDSRE